MGGGPNYRIATNPLSIPQPPLRQLPSPPPPPPLFQNELLFPVFCPSTPPTSQFSAQTFPLRVNVQESFSRTGQTTLMIRQYSDHLFSHKGPENSWQVSLKDPHQDNFAFTAAGDSIRFTYQMIKNREAKTGEEAPFERMRYTSKAVSRAQKGFLINLTRDTDTNQLHPSIKLAPAQSLQVSAIDHKLRSLAFSIAGPVGEDDMGTSPPDRMPQAPFQTPKPPSLVSDSIPAALTTDSGGEDDMDTGSLNEVSIWSKCSTAAKKLFFKKAL